MKITIPVTVTVPPDLAGASPSAVECPDCFAIVLESRLDGHRQAAH